MIQLGIDHSFGVAPLTDAPRVGYVAEHSNHRIVHRVAGMFYCRYLYRS